MAAVDRDKEEGLDPDTARLWKEQAQEIVTLANLDMPVAGTKEDEPAAAASRGEDAECLATLKNAIDQARYIADAAGRELTDPEEVVLRGFGKQLGASRKEIMALGKSLAVDQPASVVTEATRLVNNACEGIKVSREAIRAALREMGAASDISEASGPVRPRPLLPEKASSGRLEPAVRRPAVPLPTWPRPPPSREWAAGNQPAGAEWTRRPPPVRAAPEDLGAAWPPPRTPAKPSMDVGRALTETEAERRGGGVVGPHEGHDERPSE